MKIKNSWQDDPERPLLEHGPGGVVRQPHDRRDREAEPRPETRHRPEEGGAQDDGRREVQGPYGGRRHHHADENKVTVLSVIAVKAGISLDYKVQQQTAHRLLIRRLYPKLILVSPA